MRILHTSDWHLGVSRDQAPRDEEHALFLQWLLNELEASETDVLLVTGDVFHHMQPSARCLSDYYGFLARASMLPTLKRVVIIGGNHDSPSRLEAPSPVLSSLKVNVVGGLSTAYDIDPDRFIVPIEGTSKDVQLVCLAVPYIHESRLGVSSTGRRPTEIREELRTRFRTLYAFLTDRASKKWPGVPIVATGHLTCLPHEFQTDQDIYHTPIHLTFALGSLPSDIFDPRLNYVALGHVHEALSVSQAHAFYPGTPVPTTVVEGRKPRSILRVDLDPNQPQKKATVERIDVPCWRQNIEWEGVPEDLIARVESLQWDEPLPPYLYIRAKVERPHLSVINHIEETLALRFESEKPRLVRFQEELSSSLPLEPQNPLFPQSDDLDPQDVFVAMFQAKFGQNPSDEIVLAFQSLLPEQLEDE